MLKKKKKKKKKEKKKERQSVSEKQIEYKWADAILGSSAWT